MMNDLGIYIHIPFCRKKCAYCDFYSLAGREELMEVYTKALLKQMEALSSSCRSRRVDTVYIGGGTPGLLKKGCMLDILKTLFTLYDVADGAEVTIETNPATVDPDTLCAYRRAGIDRISFGIQSADEGLLRKAGRIHSYSDAVSSVNMAKTCGFENISVDLMYGLPGQTPEKLRRTLEAVMTLPVKHISLYGLKVEENTSFGRDPFLTLPDEELQCEMYLQSVETLAKKGFFQYEISNFAVPGYESKHNLRYWQRKDYLGFGPAAHSFFDGVRFFLPRDIDEYMKTEDFSLFAPCYREQAKIFGRDETEEQIMLALRTSSGVEKSVIFRFAENRAQAERYLKNTVDNGYAEDIGDRYRLTPKGMLVSNTVISDILCL